MTKGVRKFRFLFVHALILGKETAFQNIRDAVSRMEDIDAAFLPIEMETPEWFSKLPMIRRNHSLRFGLVARTRVMALERDCRPFDAAFFNHILPALMLKRFRKRVPCFDSMDVTPLQLVQDGQAYYQSTRTQGSALMTELKRKVAKSIFSGSACLLPYSEYARRSLVSDYGIPDDKILVLPPGTRLETWTNTGKRPHDSPFTVLFVGGEFIRKGGDILLAVAHRPEFRHCRFHFVTRSFVGEALPNVFIHKNLRANTQELIDLYRHSDVFVLPTRADFAPTNAITEALAAGLPVITTPVGGLGDVVANGETGFIVQADNELETAAALRTLMERKELRTTLSRKALAFARKYLDADANVRRIVDLMKEASQEHSCLHE